MPQCNPLILQMRLLRSGEVKKGAQSHTIITFHYGLSLGHQVTIPLISQTTQAQNLECSLVNG